MEVGAQEQSFPSKDKGKLNPAVLPSGAVRRYFLTTEHRGATPPVVIANPDTPYFDPYNHEFPNSDGTIHNKDDIKFSGGWTALHAAAQAKQAGPHPPETIEGPERAQAFQPVNGDIEQAKFLLTGLGHHVPAALAFPHYSSPKIDPDSALTKNGFTPLMLAIRSGHDAMAALLIERSATLDVQDNMGCTALHHACECGNTAVAAMLLAAAEHTQLGTLTAHIKLAIDLVPPVGLTELSPYCTISIFATRHMVIQMQRTAVKSRSRRPEWNATFTFRSCPATARVDVTVASSSDGVEHVPIGSWLCPLTALPADQSTGILLAPPSESPIASAGPSSPNHGVSPHGEPSPHHASGFGSPAHPASPNRRAGSPTRRLGPRAESPILRSGSPTRRAGSPVRRAGSPIRRTGSSSAGSAAARGAERRRHFALMSSHAPPPPAVVCGRLHGELRFFRLVDMRDRTGRTALIAGAAAGAAGCVEELLAAGADPGVRDAFWATAVDRAIAGGHGSIVGMIEECLTDLDAPGHVPGSAGQGRGPPAGAGSEGHALGH